MSAYDVVGRHDKGAEDRLLGGLAFRVGRERLHLQNVEHLAEGFDEIEDVDVTIVAPGAGFAADLQAVLDYFNFQSSLVGGAQSTLTSQVSTFTVTGLPGGFTYLATINGTEVSFTDDGTPTNAEVVAGLVAAINAMPDINRQVVASAGVL